MKIRQPVRAGMFYDSSPDSCRSHAEKLLTSAEVPDDLPQPLYGGLVPHAGWTYSGALAARTFRALLAGGNVGSVVLFGADHTGSVRRGEVYDSGAWRTPLGDVLIDEGLAAAVLAAGDCCRANPDAHAAEHSLEVQVPILQVLAPEAKIVPIAVPPIDLAVEIGRAVATAVGERAGEVRIVGSTDLSHHGGHFPAPGGRGEVGEQWTRANDRRMLDLIAAMDAEAILPEAQERMNACGAGAVAATVAACKGLGAEKGICLEYTNSYTVVHEKYPYELDDTTVGYASVVFA
jgi:AmmeMemoRadiSam system protein B